MVDALTIAVSLALETPDAATLEVSVERGPTISELMAQGGPTKLERILDEPRRGWTTYDDFTCDLLGIPRGVRTRR